MGGTNIDMIRIIKTPKKKKKGKETDVSQSCTRTQNEGGYRCGSKMDFNEQLWESGSVFTELF